MLDRFHKYINQNDLFRANDKLLVTVSGGIDSVVLCHLLEQSRFNFSIAHCNFGLRGEESDGDEAFVETLAEDLRVNIHIKKFDTLAFAHKNKVSIQMAARDLRYDWFHFIAEKENYNFILTAHHQNDSVETVLLNLVRGTGIAGLHGIKPKSGKIVRPLLFATKEEVKQYAIENGLNWREDSSNQSSKYHRNLLRNEVMPLLKKINPNLEETFQQTIEKIVAAESIYNNYVEGCKSEFVRSNPEYTSIEFQFLKEESEPVLILFDMLREFGFNYTQTKEIISSIDSEPGNKFISNSHLLVVDRSHLIITKKSNQSELTYLSIHIDTGIINFYEDNIQLQLKMGTDIVISDEPHIAFLDYDKLNFPLILRRWQPGDQFQPLGMKTGKKKISDFLNDIKMPLNLKENVHVLLSNNEIVWVVGLRIDDRYKAKQGKPIQQITLNHNH